MDVYDLFDRDQRNACDALHSLVACPDRPLDERRHLVKRLREALFQFGRVSNPVYQALLRHGVDPARVLVAVESHTVAYQYLIEIERNRLEGADWHAAVQLAALLIEEYFEEQQGMRGFARRHLSSVQAVQFADWNESKRAAERAASMAG